MSNNSERIINHQDGLDLVAEVRGIKEAVIASALAGKDSGQIEINDVPTFAKFLALGGGKNLFSVGKQFLVPKETAVTITSSNNSLTVSVNADTFIAAEHTVASHVYEFTYDGAVWKDEHGEDVILSSYGITVTGTPAEEDKIVVTETASNMAFDLVQYNPEGYSYPYDTTGKGDTAMLLAHKIHSYGSVPFCPPQLLVYFAQAVTSGNGYFKFTLKNAAYGGGNQYNGTYVFQYEPQIPAYGGLRLTNGIGGYKSAYAKTDVTSAKVIIYGAKYNASSHPNTFAGRGSHIKPAEITTSETRPSIVEYDSTNDAHVNAYDLGTFTASNPSLYTEEQKDGSNNLLFKRNKTERQAYGDNRFSKSIFLIWGNSTAAGSASGLGSWYYHRSDFDLCPSDSVLALAGYLHGYGQDFIDSIQTVKVKVALPSYNTGSNTYEEVECKIFLPSYTELLGSHSTSGVAEGAQLDYFKMYPGAEGRKKQSGSSYQYWFLRSAHAGTANLVWYVYSDGGMDGRGASYAYGFVPACIIKKSA